MRQPNTAPRNPRPPRLYAFLFHAVAAFSAYVVYANLDNSLLPLLSPLLTLSALLSLTNYSVRTGGSVLSWLRSPSQWLPAWR